MARWRKTEDVVGFLDQGHRKFYGRNAIFRIRLRVDDEIFAAPSLERTG